MEHDDGVGSAAPSCAALAADAAVRACRSFYPDASSDATHAHAHALQRHAQVRQVVASPSPSGPATPRGHSPPRPPLHPPRLGLRAPIPLVPRSNVARHNFSHHHPPSASPSPPLGEQARLLASPAPLHRRLALPPSSSSQHPSSSPHSSPLGFKRRVLVRNAEASLFNESVPQFEPDLGVFGIRGGESAPSPPSCSSSTSPPAPMLRAPFTPSAWLDIGSSANAALVHAKHSLLQARDAHIPLAGRGNGGGSGTTTPQHLSPLMTWRRALTPIPILSLLNGNRGDVNSNTDNATSGRSSTTSSCHASPASQARHLADANDLSILHAQRLHFDEAVSNSTTGSTAGLAFLSNTPSPRPRIRLLADQIKAHGNGGGGNGGGSANSSPSSSPALPRSQSRLPLGASTATTVATNSPHKVPSPMHPMASHTFTVLSSSASPSFGSPFTSPALGPSSLAPHELDATDTIAAIEFTELYHLFGDDLAQFACYLRGLLIQSAPNASRSGSEAKDKSDLDAEATERTTQAAVVSSTILQLFSPLSSSLLLPETRHLIQVVEFAQQFIATYPPDGSVQLPPQVTTAGPESSFEPSADARMFPAFTAAELGEWRTSLELELAIATWSEEEWHAGEHSLSGALTIVSNRMLDISDKIQSVYQAIQDILANGLPTPQQQPPANTESTDATAPPSQVGSRLGDAAALAIPSPSPSPEADSATILPYTTPDLEDPTQAGAAGAEALLHLIDDLIYIQADFSALFHVYPLLVRQHRIARGETLMEELTEGESTTAEGTKVTASMSKLWPAVASGSVLKAHIFDEVPPAEPESAPVVPVVVAVPTPAPAPASITPPVPTAVKPKTPPKSKPISIPIPIPIQVVQFPMFHFGSSSPASVAGDSPPRPRTNSAMSAASSASISPPLIHETPSHVRVSSLLEDHASAIVDEHEIMPLESVSSSRLRVNVALAPSSAEEAGGASLPSTPSQYYQPISPVHLSPLPPMMSSPTPPKRPGWFARLMLCGAEAAPPKERALPPQRDHRGRKKPQLGASHASTVVRPASGHSGAPLNTSGPSAKGTPILPSTRLASAVTSSSSSSTTVAHAATHAPSSRQMAAVGH